MGGARGVLLPQLSPGLAIANCSGQPCSHSNGTLPGAPETLALPVSIHAPCESDEGCRELPDTPTCVHPKDTYYTQCISCNESYFQAACHYWQPESFVAEAERKCDTSCQPFPGLPPTPPPIEPSAPPPFPPPSPPPPQRPEIPTKSLLPILIASGCAGLLVLVALLAKWGRNTVCYVQRQRPTYISIWDRCRDATPLAEAPEQSEAFSRSVSLETNASAASPTSSAWPMTTFLAAFPRSIGTSSFGS